ncbi:MAG: flagellar basal body L-ring protein FlgH [Deltaproteobacteria bacterium]|nr:flagellar basal body L-ring protein FlgH [Planctomycetota bacterium]MBM4279557.1 flagellar basal body L-ring protein FlgH [Deltaproteobacteria bacterium]
MSRAVVSSVVLVVVVAVAGGCATPHVAEYTPRRRVAPEALPTEQGSASDDSGSLWVATSSRTSSPFADLRALSVNDVVIVRVEEVADARRGADTRVTRNGRFWNDLSFVPLVGPLLAGLADASVQATAGADSQNSFTGEGRSGRSERLLATVPASVRKVYDNGNMFIEGHRVVLVNNEEQHLYVSGIVRPIDIDEQNSIKSSMIADAEIEFVGQGAMTDGQSTPWGTRVASWVWPF